MRRLALLTLLLLSLSGCQPKIQADMFTSAELGSRAPKTYVVLPFESRISERETRKHPDAHEVLTDAFETAFLETGARLVERARLREVLGEAALSASGLTEEDTVRLGKLLSADAVLFGTVTAYHKGGFGSQATTVSLTVKAIDVASGAILWKGTSTYTGAPMGTNYSIDPAVAARDAAKGLVAELLKKQGAR